jgi:type IV secretory pathway VirJ component
MGVAAAALPSLAHATVQENTDTIVLRGQPQHLHLYGVRGSGPPVVVTSGDGGWMHLAPDVADILARAGCFVVGVDARAYLESFTSRAGMLATRDEPGDFRTLAAYAAGGSAMKPVLVGVSEGAGLSLLAATDPATKAAVGGVIGLGLPDVNELGWRWRDAIIYVTHRTPDEPTFSTAALAPLIAPLPLAAIHSTHDEFVPLAEVERVMTAARDPKRVWLVEAANHRFSDNLSGLRERLLEALAWVRQQDRRA